MLLAFCPPAFAQKTGSSKDLASQAFAFQNTPEPQAAPAADEGGPVTLTLKDALALAQKNDPQFQAALSDAAIAAEDVRQARAARYPTLSGLSQYLGTQGNGKTPDGRFVTNDGIHVYNEWAVLHQDLNASILTGVGIGRASAAEALARARAEVARRGLVPTVTRAYYSLLVAQRKYSTAQQAVDEAQRVLTITQNLERGGEVAHSDVIKSQLQLNVQQQALRDADLSMQTSRLDLAVLLYPDFNQNFSVVDDLDLSPPLPPLADVQTMAQRDNPELRVAMAALRGAGLDRTLARQAYFPTVSADFVEGIQANAFALESTQAAYPEFGPLPNLGYFVTLSMNIPVWDWGQRRSRVRQATFKQQQAKVELSYAQRNLVRNLQAFYAEARTARDQMDSLRSAVDLASESLRLTLARYQAGEASILDLVDAQTSVTQSRNAYDDGILRYRAAISNLQSLTGNF